MKRYREKKDNAPVPCTEEQPSQDLQAKLPSNNKSANYTRLPRNAAEVHADAQCPI